MITPATMLEARAEAWSTTEHHPGDGRESLAEEALSTAKACYRQTACQTACV